MSSHLQVIRFILNSTAVLCALAVVLSAQDQPTIRTNVPLVLVPVTVTDKKGNSIDGLKVDDFVIGDDGVRQDIRMDTSDSVLAPVSLVVAVQCSGISASALAKINRVGGMIQPLITGDRGSAAVIAFDDEVRVLQGFTSDSSKIRAAFQKIHSGTMAAIMLDAVAEGIKMLEARPANQRR